MKSLFTMRHGGPEVLAVRESPDPLPSKGQVRIRVARAGLNFADVSARLGLYPDAPKPPMVVGYEVSGTVDAVGEGVTRLTAGTRVLALTRFGGHADCVVVPELFAQPLPDSVSLDFAAALPVNYLTAYHMLFCVGRLRSGDKLLLHMAAGGVGLAVLDLLKEVPGVEVFGTASASKHALLREAGVHHPIDYRTQDYVAEVRRLTQGTGVQLILDALGGPDWNRGFELLAPAGQLIAFGWANMVTGPKRNPLHVVRQFLQMKRYSPMRLMDTNRSVTGVNVGHLWDAPGILQPELQALLRLATEGKIAPRVDRVFPLSQAADAHRFIQERKNVGKVLFDCTC